ncbi:hypothetical protein M747DRAFT_320705 [Aspergillus niger ATCC 13496]|uniref:Nuclear GTPase SLIP-GC n=1 Tax=Aspergillus niger ATCC 13496 TaxID=1353008 RepID=A0A370CC52_ASPNG|nr:hypothetical protein ANI_1_1298164 [Aspergillus niger CBS 513.88]RDH24701.1 hypothetical protein M747DRAFT_320705 [Aspergillus niger ATCC 13496]|eukprot:XP_001398830.2 hypothetical protein ANI_1_1298164 [Aspergillus niger CBS 513.88]
MEGGARPSSVFPRNQDQVLKRAELHFVTEQTARHERSWEGKVDKPACPNFNAIWAYATPNMRRLYIDCVKYVETKGWHCMYADYECSLKALYEEYYARTDQRAAEMTSCVDFADFKVFVDSIDSESNFPQNAVSKEESGDNDVVPDLMLVDQAGREPETEMEAAPSDVDVPMTDPAEQSLECGIKDADSQEIIALENAVAKGADVLKELHAVFAGSTAFGTETDRKAEIERIQKYACTEKVIIGVVGSTGAGKSSLINAVLDEKAVLSTDCMRASTAVATEISYNYRSTKYRAEIEFIKHIEWERELEVLFAELQDHQEEVTRGAIPKNSDAAVALDKIQAVYPTMTADNILNTSAADLMANRRVTDLLGTTKAFEGSDPRAFSMKLKSYIDSKGKRGRSKKSARSQDAAEHPDSASDTDTANQGIGLWPLVRVVRIYTKAPALATGAVLVDLPGIFDSNAARVAVAEDYMRRCSAHWIVAPINRAVDDKVARDLLGKNYKLQMQMDCAFNDMTFICTKTDDIVPTEVIQSLGLDLPAFNEVQQLPARVELMMGEIDALEEAKKKISTQLDLIETEIEDLEERLNDEFGCDVLEITPKRKKPHGHEPSETPTVHEASATELSEVDKLKNQFLKLKVERKALRSQRKHINQQMENKEAELQKLEDGKKEMEHAVLSSCIEARNRFSKCQIKRGFALEIQSLDQEIADDDSENPVQAPVCKYDELERNLPVFCVSTRAYQSLRGRSDMAKLVGGFSQLEETEIPLLQRFLTQLNELFQSMTLWYSVRSAADVSEQRVKELEAGFECALDALDEDMGAHKNRFNRTVRDIFQQNILNKLSGASRHAILQFPEAVSRWNEGLRWNTYKAICRRRGVYRTTDWNRDLARPMFDKIAAAWRRTFNELLPHAMRTMTDDLEVVLGRFHKKAIDSVEQDVSDETKKRLQSTLVACQQSMRQRFWEMRKSTTLEQKRISRAFAEAIAERLEDTYRACASETGLGSWKRSRALMQQVADDHAKEVLRGSTEHAKHELEELLDSQEAEVDQIIQSRLRRISRDYHGALIAPQIQLCTEEQARIKREVAKIVERAEAELQLGHLLGGVRSS